MRKSLLLPTFLALLTAGCSGPNGLLIHHHRSRQVDVVLTYTDYDSQLVVRETKVSGHHQGGLGLWFGAPPKEFWLEIDKEVYHYTPETYPDPMNEGSSLGSDYNFDIEDSGAKLSGPTFFSNFERQGGWYVLSGFGCCLLVPVLFVLALRPRAPKAPPIIEGTSAAGPVVQDNSGGEGL